MSMNLVTWLHSEAPPRRVYARPPLALALCQIRYATRFGLNDLVIAPFQAAIEYDYPSPSRHEDIAAIQIGSGGNQIDLTVPSPGVMWKFTDETGDWTVSLTQDFLSLETRSYADFDDFIVRLGRLMTALTETVKLGVGRRIGLRYINEIRGSGIDWRDVITPELLGVLALEPFRQNCDHAYQVLTLRTPDARVNLQHGLFPNGSTVLPKSDVPPSTEPFYLVDIDMFREFPLPHALEMTSPIVSGYVESFHATVSELFRWATTDAYRSSLGEGS